VGSLFLLLAVALILVRQGRNILARLLVPISLVVAITYIAFSGNSIHDSTINGYAIIIVISGLLLGERGLFIAAIMVVLGIIFLGLADMNGMTTTFMAQKTGYDDIGILSLLLITSASMLRLLLVRSNNSLRRARENERIQIDTNNALRTLQASLEERVNSRTKELQDKSAELGKYAQELEAVSEISSAMVSIQDLNMLLATVVNLVSERFGYYHTGIFILDEATQNLVLRAASSEGGQRMLMRRFNLKFGTESLVGFAASRGIPRISQDVEADLVFLPEPDLAATKSEAAFPLIAGKQIIGVLDIESTDKNPFTESEVKILSTLANQIAISTQNVRSFNETRRALANAEEIYQRFVEQGWRRITSEAANMGYMYSAKGVNQLNTPLSAPEIQSATASGKLVVSQEETGSVAVPVKMRGQVLGVLNIRSTDETHKWDDDELALIQAAADRAALALENARLLDESQRRASKERTIGELTARISAATDINSILQTAVTEIGRTIGGSEVSIQFRKPQDS
jgi:GAF domain-containing protein